MKHLTSILAAVLVATTVSGAAAQAPASSASSPAPAAPRVELGAGGAWFLAANAPGALTLVDTRATLRLTRTWDVEGVVTLRPGDNGYGGIYRIQARWRLPLRSSDGSLQTHLAFGGAGFILRWSHPAYDYKDYYTHEMRHVPAASGWNVDYPMYPTAAFGVQKVLGAHLAVRADLNVHFGVGDYGVSAVLLPTIGVSIPIGRYPSSRVR